MDPKKVATDQQNYTKLNDTEGSSSERITEIDIES